MSISNLAREAAKNINVRKSLFKRAAQNYEKKNKQIENYIKSTSKLYNIKLSNNNLINMMNILNKIRNYNAKKKQIDKMIYYKKYPRVNGLTVRTASKKRKRNFIPKPSRFKK